MRFLLTLALVFLPVGISAHVPDCCQQTCITQGCSSDDCMGVCDHEPDCYAHCMGMLDDCEECLEACWWGTKETPWE